MLAEVVIRGFWRCSACSRGAWKFVPCECTTEPLLAGAVWVLQMVWSQNRAMGWPLGGRHYYYLKDETEELPATRARSYEGSAAIFNGLR